LVGIFNRLKLNFEKFYGFEQAIATYSAQKVGNFCQKASFMKNKKNRYLKLMIGASIIIEIQAL